MGIAPLIYLNFHFYSVLLLLCITVSQCKKDSYRQPKADLEVAHTSRKSNALVVSETHKEFKTANPTQSSDP